METTTETPIAMIKNIFLRRDDEFLLSETSWVINKGEHWAVMGPNGAGKTLLMQILNGYLWPTDGSVEILGETLGQVDLRVLRRRLGWVSKNLEDRTPGDSRVLEVILSGPRASFGLYEAASPEEIEKAEKLAEEYGLNKILNRAFGVLSSGEKQRTLLARAVLANPEILFLDEPMSNLDMGGRELFLRLLEKLALKDGGPTIILTTHNTLEIAPFMTHALIMKKGGVAAQGTLDETLNSKYLSEAFNLPFKVEKTSNGRYMAYL